MNVDTCVRVRMRERRGTVSVAEFAPGGRKPQRSGKFLSFIHKEGELFSRCFFEVGSKGESAGKEWPG